MRQVYEEQKLNPVKGDWIELLQNDCEKFEIIMNEGSIAEMSKAEYKLIVKTKIKEYVFST